MSAPATAQAANAAPAAALEPPPVARPLRRAIGLTGLSGWQLAAAVFFGALTQAASVALAGASAWLIVRASQMPPVLSLQVAVVGVRAFGITRGVSRYVERLTAHRVALNGMTELRVRLYQRMAGSSGAGAASLARGDVLARVGADIDAVGDLVVRGIIPALVAAVVVVGTAGAVAAFLPLAGLAVFACLAAVGVGGPLLTLRAARISELMASAARSEVSASAMNIIENSSELRVSGQMTAASVGLKRREADLERATEAAAKPAAFANALTEVGSGAALILTLVLSQAAYAAGAVSATEVAVIVLMPLAAFEAVAALTPAAAQVYRSRAAAARIVALSDAGHAAPAPRPAPEVEAAADTGALTAKGLAAGWAPGRPVVAEADLTLEPGGVIGLVGESGTGKTTLLATLAGLLEPLAGEALVGGAPVAALGSEKRGRAVAFIPEDAHIFATTVLENLRVARGDLSPKEAAAVLGRVGLERWLDALPEGLDTLLGAGGSTVSGGERRRLLLARALVSPARHILLDEPGEHLDALDARRLTAELMAAARDAGRGLMIVSHQEDSLAGADQVWRVAGGRLTGPGRR
ncbi:MAG: thiol reductant ABC exporter subunit CydC [Bifidobacteriaceae bacterium]|jgi:ATP-binding cassette subfamily C protein CydC|nr:thiol reductant ABC exporter subunit CydC [Bifidobacteriaceae bacterium]